MRQIERSGFKSPLYFSDESEDCLFQLKYYSLIKLYPKHNGHLGALINRNGVKSLH